MRRQGYWTMEFISISRILRNAPAQYTCSYLYTETDEIQDLERLVKRSTKRQQTLNYRQMAALSRAVKSEDSIFTVESHRGAHKVTYDTARTDLLKMVAIGFLSKSKIGRAFAFRPAKNLGKRLKGFEGRKWFQDHRTLTVISFRVDVLNFQGSVDFETLVIV